MVTRLKQATIEDIRDARLWTSTHHSESSSETEIETWEGPCWTSEDLKDHLSGNPGRCLLYIDGYILDVSAYLKTHVMRFLLPNDYSIDHS
jgi:stearoyl-CoA desaturase (delta-9 desaturase)